MPMPTHPMLLGLLTVLWSGRVEEKLSKGTEKMHPGNTLGKYIGSYCGSGVNLG